MNEPHVDERHLNQRTDWTHSIDKAEIAYRKQDYQRAELMLRSALKQCKEKKQSNSELALPVVLENLALVFMHQGRFVRAERVLKRALLLVKDGQTSSRLMYRLAELYLLQGRFSLAERVTADAGALGQLCRSHGASTETLQLLRLANLWNNWGQEQTALGIYRKVQAVRRESQLALANLTTDSSLLVESSELSESNN